MRQHEFINELGKTEKYKKPIGMMEMYKFMQIATPEQKQQLKTLINQGLQKKAWDLLQFVTNVKLGEAEEGTQQADEIYNALEGAGYTLLGSGQEATVWAKKDQNDVIKIIMPDDGKGAGRQAELFYKFYEFCQEHSNYENLPKFTDLGAGKALERFEVNGVEYMAIAMEKLTPIPEGSFEEAMVWQLSDLAMRKISWQQAWKVLTDPYSWETFEEDRVLSTIDELEGLNDQERLKYEVLFKLMTLLYHTGRINKVGWDLHTENAMMRGDTIVITDPWFGELT